MIRITHKWLAISLLAMLSACSTGTKHNLPISHDFGPIGEQGADNIAVMFDAPVWLWDERIRYRLLYKNATIIHHYNLNRWEAPLPALLERRLTLSSKQPVKISIYLTQFEQQFTTSKQSHVVLDLTVSVLAEKDYRLIAKRSFNLSQNSASPDALGAIAGFMTLTEQAEADIQVWLETLFDKK
jgi:cholesterol transport system auxiliary component